MKILIEKDSATRIPKECTREEAEALAARFPVSVVVDDEGRTQTWDDWLAANPAGDSAARTPTAHTEDELRASAIKRHGLTEAKFKKMPAADRDAMLLNESALLEQEAASKTADAAD